MINAWERTRDALSKLESFAENGHSAVVSSPVDAVKIEAPLPSRERRIWSLGANTVKHTQGATKQLLGRAETEEQIMAPKLNDIYPIGFDVHVDSVVGPNERVTPPKFAKKIDYEGECAVILKMDGNKSSFWGYTGWNDLSIRDTHLGLMANPPALGYSFHLQKNFDGANVCGPWIVVDEPYDVRNLNCKVLVNGELRQDWNTSEMIYSFDDALDHISRYMALKSGDILTSGTGAGVALEGPLDGPLWLKGGDVVDVQLEGVGSLITTINDWTAV